ncbi:MAG TPA: hypothetical protein VG013_19305, partial [Gemmataceae bacterium]|nr:hypothetical protein [Gemmataceae bacterium]
HEGNGDSRSAPETGPELDQLRADNAQLRQAYGELQHLLEDRGSKQEQTWAQRQKDYEGLLEEKSDIIRTLHGKIQELETQAAQSVAIPPEEELVAMSEQLERDRAQIQQERRQLEDDLRQFQEDEDSMTRQMREMEVQMARERADLARQRNDIQRILDEIRHELDRNERDQGLNDRLGQLRQRYQEVATRRPAPGQAAGAPQADAAPRKAAAPKKKDSSIIRRLFGQGR